MRFNQPAILAFPVLRPRFDEIAHQAPESIKNLSTYPRCPGMQKSVPETGCTEDRWAKNTEDPGLSYSNEIWLHFWVDHDHRHALGRWSDDPVDLDRWAGFEEQRRSFDGRLAATDYDYVFCA